ncbi:MFS general substrate transporter [Flagelloscypha sp. PMI_526]|nr:MFS general substrate transporter [Flagelloscypha sp. PMI_526]
MSTTPTTDASPAISLQDIEPARRFSRTPIVGSLDEDEEHRLNESSLPPVDGGANAWSFLAAAFVVEAIVWGFPSSFGVFLEGTTSHANHIFQLSVIMTSNSAYLKDPRYGAQPNAEKLLPLVGTLTSGIIYCAGPLLNPYCNRYPRHRQWILWSGVLLVVVSLFGASWFYPNSTQVPGLVALQGATYAVGGAFLYLPTTAILPEWFVERRGMANGILFAGRLLLRTGFGGIILPLVFPPLISRFGSRVTLRFYAVAIGLLMLPLLPFLKGRLPVTSIRGPLPRSSGDRNMWKNGSIWSLLGLNTLQGFAYFVPLIWLPSESRYRMSGRLTCNIIFSTAFANELHFSSSKSALTLALLNGSSVVGRVGLGYLSDVVNPMVLAISQLLATSILTFVLWGVFSSNFAGLLVFSMAYGAVAGGWSSLWSGFVRPIAKDDLHLTNNMFGLLLLTRGIGNILSTPISTSILTPVRERTDHWKFGFEVGSGKYENLIWYVGTCFAGAAVFATGTWLVENRLERRRSTVS